APVRPSILPPLAVFGGEQPGSVACTDEALRLVRISVVAQPHNIEAPLARRRSRSDWLGLSSRDRPESSAAGVAARKAHVPWRSHPTIPRRPRTHWPAPPWCMTWSRPAFILASAPPRGTRR